MKSTAEKVSVFGARRVCSASRAARFLFGFPFEGKLRPQAVMRCRFRLRNRFFLWDFVLLTEIFRQRRSLPVFLSQFPAPADGRRGDSRIARLPDFVFTTEISRLRRRLKPLFLSRRKKKREKERPLRGLRREVSPDLLRRTEMKSKTGAQCGSAPRDPPGNGCDRWRQ